jgi:hypothetical protein
MTRSTALTSTESASTPFGEIPTPRGRTLWELQASAQVGEAEQQPVQLRVLQRELAVGQSASDEISHRVVGVRHPAGVLSEARKPFTHHRFDEPGHAPEVRVDRHRGRADLARQCPRLNRRRSVSFEYDQSGGHEAAPGAQRGVGRSHH